MFKPGTLVKLAAGYERLLCWRLLGKEADSEADFWLKPNHVGMFLRFDYDNCYVQILVEDQIIAIHPKALQKI